MSEFDNAPCGLVILAADGTIRAANAMFFALTGHAPDAIVGSTRFSALLAGGGRIYYETHFAPLLQIQGAVRGIALEIVHAQGTKIPVLINANQHETNTYVAVFEATDRRAYERELLRAKEEAERAERKASSLAHTLQQTLIPPTPPEIPGLDVAAAYRPAGAGDEVGGDFYDVFPIDEDDWVIVVGDVQGKGAPAAVLTALARHTVRAAAVLEQDPGEILNTVNTVMHRDPTNRFCTVALARLMRVDRAWRVMVGTGGHPLPLLCRQHHDPATIGEPGMLIGVWEDASWESHTTLLEPGDVLLLFTDGVTEARQGKEFYGDDRLAALARREASDAATLVDAVVADATHFQGDITRDDIVVVAVGVPAG